MLLRLLWILVSTCGCSVLTDSEARQCSGGADCPAAGGPYNCVSGVCVGIRTDEQWDCSPSTSEGTDLDVFVGDGDDIREPAIVGARVVVCERLEPSPANPTDPCENPLLDEVTDERGVVVIPQVPPGYSGFAVVSSPGRLPTVATISPTLVGPGLTVRSFTQDYIDTLSEFLGLPPVEPTQAFGALRVFNCAQEFGPGASVTISPAPSGAVFYQRVNFASLSVEDTDESGAAGVLGLNPGLYQVEWQVGRSGVAIGAATLAALPGHVAEAVVYAGEAESE